MKCDSSCSFEQRLNIGIATREGRHILKPLDNSKEKENHAKRISTKISCFYSRDYQIPDQPRITKVNSSTVTPPEVLKIVFKDSWDPVEAPVLEVEEEPEKIEEEKAGKFFLFSEIAPFADVDEEVIERNDSEDDNLSVYTQIQLQKEPNKGILKATCPGETAEDRDRWSSAIKLLTFFGLNFEKNAEFLMQTSRLGFIFRG